MKILSPHDQTGWITCIIAGRWVQAKVYDEPSTYGVNNCRVSKLTIGKTQYRDPSQDFFDQMDYNYDRGLDFNNLTDPTILETVLTELNNLPSCFPA
jgi:hypothetical protein